MNVNDRPELDATAAQEQLDIVQHALRRAGHEPRPAPVTYLAWGVTSFLFNLAYVPALAAQNGAIFFAAEIVMVVAYLLTIYEYAVMRRARTTSVDQQALIVFAVVTTVLWILKLVWYSDGLVGGAAFALMWSLGFAIALIVHGAGPMRPLLAGGLVILAAVFVASLAPATFAVALAVGNLLGLAGPGVYFLLRRR